MTDAKNVENAPGASVQHHTHDMAATPHRTCPVDRPDTAHIVDAMKPPRTQGVDNVAPAHLTTVVAVAVVAIAVMAAMVDADDG